MKTATYMLLDGTEHKVDYDPDAPCWITRDGLRWTLAECFDAHRRFNDSRQAASAGAKREEGSA